VAFSPSGKQLAAAVGKSAIVWDASTGAVAKKIDQKGIVESVEFMPDGGLLVRAGKLVTVDALGSPRAIQFKASPMSVSVSPDGKSLLAPGGKAHAQLWDMNSGKAGLVLGDDLDNDAYFAEFSPRRYGHPDVGLRRRRSGCGTLPPATARDVDGIARRRDGRRLLLT
jgi:WD40 repeat protein